MTIPQENVQPIAQEQQRPNDKEYNFAQIRKQLEQERMARVQAEQRAQELEKLTARKQNVEDDDDDDDEPYVDHKKLNKKLAAFEQNIEKKIDEKAEHKARMLLEEERRQMYLKENHDFHQVMSEQNVQKFAEKHPEIARSVLNMPDGFERQKLVYNSIKALKIDRPEDVQSSTQSKIDANRRSPYYQPSGIASAPYGNSGDFSQTGQKTAYDQMMALKNRLRGF